MKTATVWGIDRSSSRLGDRLMLSVLSLLLGLLLQLLALPVPTWASTVTAPADQDSWLKEAAPTDNFGTEKELPIKQKSGDSERAVYRFNLAAVPANAEVTSATLTLRVTTADSQPVNVYRITAPWSESTVNWATTGTAFDPTTVYGTFMPSQDDAFVTVDLTGLVQEWVCGEANHGLMLIPTSNDQQSKYYSKEEDIANFRPVLTVDVGAQTGPCPGALPTITSVLPDTLTVTQGGTGQLTVTIDPVQAGDTDVSLNSSDSGVAGVSTTVTVPAGVTAATVSVSANTPGTAQITASLNGTSATSVMTVTSAVPTVVALEPPVTPITQGGTVTLTVTISAAQSLDTPVTFTVSPNGILSVPATVTVLAGQLTASVPVEAVDLGTAMVQAFLNGTTAEAAIQVTPPPPEVTALTPSPLTVVAGASGTLTVSLNVAQTTNTEVTVTVDDPALLGLPATVTVAPGQLTVDVTVNGLAVGTATVTATVNTSSAQAMVQVIPPLAMAVSLLPSPLEIQEGATGHLTLTINAAQQSDTTVPLTNAAPTIIDIPTSVMVPAGQTSVAIPVTALLVGNATVTANLNGSSATASVVVTVPPPVVTALAPATQTLPKGVPGVIRVFVSSAPMAPTPVTLASTAPGIASVPAMVTIPAGDLFADFPVVTNGIGTALITATLNGGTATAHVIVTPPELVALTIAPQDPTDVVGATILFTATGTLTDGTTQDLTSTVTWTSSDQAVATIASDGLATALAVGITTMTATHTVPEGTFSDSSQLTLQPTPTLSLTPATATMQIGETQPFTVTSSEPAGTGGLVVTIAQSGTGTVLISPTSLTILEGETTATFTVTADSSGTVTVTASAPARTDGTSTITIALGPPAITDVTPLTGPVGTPITMTGQSFDPTVGNTQVTFTGASGTITAIITSTTTTTITTTVPQSAVTGPITVTTPLGNAASPQPFTVTLSQDFLLSATPPQITTLQGGQSNYVLSVTGIGTFTGLVNLAATGLPSGVTAEFTSPALTTGQTGYLTVRTDGTVPAGPVAFTVTGTAPLENGPTTQVLPLILQVVAGGGQTALSGSFLETDTEEPIPGVVVSIGTNQATTDAAGNFLLQNLSAGSQKLMVSGNTPHGAFSYSYDATLTVGQTNVLQPFYLKPDPPLTQFTQIANSTSDQVMTDPRYPGFSMTLPTGVTIMGWDNTVKTGMAFERLSPNRLPVPPPPVEVRAVYQTFFTNAAGVTPMGGFLTPPGSVIPFSIPNDLGLNPGDQAEMWVYDATPLNLTEPAGWKMVGFGTVSAGGMSIATNPGVGIDRFCKACGFPTCSCLANDKKKCGKEPGDATGADPVDLRTGDFTADATDLTLPGRYPIQIGRSYNPRDLFSFGGGGILNSAPILSFGKGWTLSLDITLIRLSNSIRLILPNTRRLDLILQPDGTYKNMTDPFLQGAVLQTLGNGDRQLRFKDGTTWTFRALFFPPIGPPLEFLIEQADRNGNTVTIERNGHVITRILDASGRLFTVTTVGDRIAAIQDPIGRTMSYNYDSSGRLNFVTNPEGGTTRYTYDDEGRLLTITNPRGIQFLENFYGPSGRVLRQVLADGGEFFLKYEVQAATVTGPNCPGINCPTVDSWENFQAGFSFTDGISNATTVVDPRGNHRTVRFNSRGYTTERTDNLGQVTKFTLGKDSLPLEQIDSLGRRTVLTYDSVGNVISIIDPEGNLAEFEYEPTFNRLTKLRRFLDQNTFLESSFTYDPTNGDLLTSSNPLNETTTIAYNGFGQPTTVQGPIQTEPPSTFQYDSVGNQISTIDSLGNTTLMTYDSGSRLISQTDPRGIVTRFRYDNLNRITETADAANRITRFGYDDNSNLLAVIDAKNQATSYTYDNMDQLKTRTDALSRTEIYNYDLAGNLGSVIDRKGQETQFQYDEINRRITASFADGTLNNFIYDAVGRLTQASDSVNGDIERVYDNLNRLLQEITPQGTVAYQYDALGRRTRMTANGQTPVIYHYDDASRVTRLEQGSIYAALGYDQASRRTSLSYSNGVTTSYSYDVASRLERMTHTGLSGLIEELLYKYDTAGNRTSITRANGLAVHLPDALSAATYDAANQQISFASATIDYDMNGNLTDDGTNAYQWDARNRLISISGGSTASFNYDAIGRRVEKIVDGHAINYLYDGIDIVQEIVGSSTDVRYLRSLDIDEPFVRQGNTNEFYHADALGSPVALTNSAATNTMNYGYEPFGETTGTGSSSNTVQFTGRDNDGTGLYYYRARYYSPRNHRFLGEDPILAPLTPLTTWLCQVNRTQWLLPNILSLPQQGLSHRIHQTAYVMNNPLLRTDARGLEPDEDECALGYLILCAAQLDQVGHDAAGGPRSGTTTGTCIINAIGPNTTYSEKNTPNPKGKPRRDFRGNPGRGADAATVLENCFSETGMTFKYRTKPDACKPDLTGPKCEL